MRNLPWSVEAFFFMAGDGPDALVEEASVRKMHREFLLRYELSASDMPLLQMDLSQPKAAFEVMI